MRGLLVILGVSLFSAAGWWLGEPMGLMAAFVLSIIGSGIGLYASRRLVQHLLP